MKQMFWLDTSLYQDAQPSLSYTNNKPLKTLLVQGCTSMMYICQSHDSFACHVLAQLLSAGCDVTAEDNQVCSLYVCHETQAATTACF